MIFYDETLDRYPWLEPPRNLKSEEYGKGGWEDQVSGLPSLWQSIRRPCLRRSFLLFIKYCIKMPSTQLE
jgi:hypothetical protein